MVRVTGTYYFVGVKSKGKYGLKRLSPSKNFVDLHIAIKEARKRQRQGKILQATIYHTKNMLLDKDIAGLDTKGITKRYNQENKCFEAYNMAKRKFMRMR